MEFDEKVSQFKVVETEEFTPNGASSGHFPEDQAERVDIRLLE